MGLDLPSHGGANLPASAGQTRPSRARAGDPRALGGRGDVREAPRTEPWRPDLLLHGRAGHREPDVARRPYGLGPDPEGCLPALQGAAGLRPALPEWLRL